MRHVSADAERIDGRLLPDTMGTGPLSKPSRTTESDVSEGTDGPKCAEAAQHVSLKPFSDRVREIPSVRPVTRNEVRIDALTGKQIIFASGRDQRPVEFAREIKVKDSIGDCPFCLGNEEMTPATLLEVPGVDASDPWQVRVVSNKYPAVALLCPETTGLVSQADAACNDSGATAFRHATRNSKKRSATGLFSATPIVGGHEVIVESPYHTSSVSELNVSHLAKVYGATAERIRVWKQIPEIEYVSVFKNVGARAGASLSHAHSQLIATSVLPQKISEGVKRAGKHYSTTGCCLQCDLMRAEIDAAERIVFKTDHFVAYCPYASSLPYLTRIVPRVHSDCFETEPAAVLADLAQLTRRLVQCFERLLPGAAYNHIIHTKPPATNDADSYHWTMEWMPRLTTQAGFEYASDCFINPTFPETAASNLRQIAQEFNPLRVAPPRSGYSISER